MIKKINGGGNGEYGQKNVGGKPVSSGLGDAGLKTGKEKRYHRCGCNPPQADLKTTNPRYVSPLIRLFV